MNATMAIAAHELRERGRLFLITAGLAAVPFLAALAPAARNERVEVISLLGAIIAIALGGGVAAAAGATTVARELSEKRVSFLLSKPVSSASIWGGKALAGVASALLCFVIVAIPVEIFAGEPWRFTLASLTPALIVVGFAVAVFLVSHAASSMARSRSIWIAVDFVLATTVGWLLFNSLTQLLRGGAHRLFEWTVGAICIVVVLILAIAPLFQLERGRADLRRGHRALSLAIWGPLLSVALLVGGYVLWLGAAPVQALEEIHLLTQSPSGRYVFASGHARLRGDYESAHIIDAASGDSVRLRPVDVNTIWAREADVMLGQRWDELFLAQNVELVLYRNGKQIVHATPLRLNGLTLLAALSADGTRLATVGKDEGLTIYDTSDARVVASAKVPSIGRLMFLGNDRLRLFAGDSRGPVRDVEVLDFDVAAKRLEKRGTFALGTDFNALSASDDGRRVYVSTRGVIVDPNSGATLATLDGAGDRPGVSGRMLNDGSVMVVAQKEGHPLLRVFSPEGTLRAETRIPGVRRAWLSGEIDGGKVLVATRKSAVPGLSPVSERSLLVIDAATGKIDARVERFSPSRSWTSDPRMTRYAAEAEIAGADAAGKLARWNRKTGELKRMFR